MSWVERRKLPVKLPIKIDVGPSELDFDTQSICLFDQLINILNFFTRYMNPNPLECLPLHQQADLPNSAHSV